jgi:hypothetical protein
MNLIGWISGGEVVEGAMRREMELSLRGSHTFLEQR